jgi:hypothetical protein
LTAFNLNRQELGLPLNRLFIANNEERAVSLDTNSIEHGPARPTGQRSEQNRILRSIRPAGAKARIRSALTAARDSTQPSATGKSAVRHALAAPSTLRRAYLRMLAPAHRLVRDRHVEKLLFRPSSAAASPAAGKGAQAIYEGPIPGQVLDWIIDDLDITLRECAFVDFRAGNGRTLLYAAMHDFERVIGFEYNLATHEDAQLNISQFPRTLMKCRDVECRRGDQDDIAIPRQPLVLFFPNASREKFMSLILDHVSASYRTNPRRMYLVMENPGEMQAFGHDDIFYGVKLPLATSLKLKLFSPVDIRIYRSIV